MKKLQLIAMALLVSISSVLFAENIEVKGVVTDSSNGEPVAFASVVVKGTTTGVYTDENGNYHISVSSNGVLLFSSIGYKDLVVSVNGRKSINAQLTPDAVNLDDVVIVAYGTAKKESITGAISTTNSKNIEKRTVTNAISALEGATSGVQINNTNGEPGSAPEIRIRGFSTVNGTNDPLYVVDGVPMSGTAADINANDIESISVLKDAASAAMYGNRAANGVILITTKKGKSEKFTVKATVRQGIYNRGIPEYEKMSPDQFMETYWKSIYNGLYSDPNDIKDGYTPEEAYAEATDRFWSEVEHNIYTVPKDKLFQPNGKLAKDAKIKKNIQGDLDWFKPIERLGHRQEYNVSGDGAFKKASFYFSGNYLNEKGYLISSDFKRFTGRLNASVTPTKWLKVGMSLNGSHRVSNATSADGSTSYVNPFFFARNMAPIYPVHVHDFDSPNGDYILDEVTHEQQFDYGQDKNVGTRGQFPNRNVILESMLNVDQKIKNTLDGLLYADITFLKDFKFSIKGQLYTSNQENRSYDNSTVGDGAGSNGRAKRQTYRYRNYTFQQQLTWNRSFNEVHNVDIFLGHENYSMTRNYLYGYAQDETFAGTTELINFSLINKMYDYTDTYTNEGYIARARYNYDNKYFVEASYRRDGSSRFHPDHRWGNFWSVGASWMISREKWLKDSKGVNDLKLRASYGEVGNDQSVGYYGYMGLYDLGLNGTRPSIYKTQYGAPDIKWESTNSFGVAVEGRFFNRFNVSVEYYDKKSHDLLFDVYIPLSFGPTDKGERTATVTRNLGDISNRGVEINFDIDLIKSKNVLWNFGFNASTLKNKILTLPEQNRKDGIISGTKRFVEGGGRYDYWLYQAVGVDQMTGHTLYKIDDQAFYEPGANVAENDNRGVVPDDAYVKINGKGYTTKDIYAKKDWSGSAIPDLFGSFNTSLSWKGLSVSALFTYSLGGKTLDYSYRGLMAPDDDVNAFHVDLLKAWNGVPKGMKENSPNRIDPKGIAVPDVYMNEFSNAVSNKWLRSSNYLVIKNINIAYQLPSSFCKKLTLSGVSINAGVENLATFTKLKGMDPQQSFAGTTNNHFTAARTFSIGLNIIL